MGGLHDALRFDFQIAKSPRPPAFLRETRPGIVSALRLIIGVDREDATECYRAACDLASRNRGMER